MDFNEAHARAKAAHTVTKVCHQPGNNYETEYICRCKKFVFRRNWKQHLIDETDKLLEDQGENRE